MKLIMSNKKNILSIKSIIYIFIFFAISAILLIFPNTYIYSIKNSISIFFEGILPSLFPFMILSEIAISSNIFDNFSRILQKPISKLFRVSKYSSIAIISGFICGFPSGSKAVDSLYEQGKISKKDANILISFINNCNPAFIISTIGIIVFKSIYIGLILAISHYLSSILIGIIYSRYYNLHNNIIHEKMSNLNTNTKISCNNEENVIKILKKAIKNSLVTLGIIFGYIAIFNLSFDILKSIIYRFMENDILIEFLSPIFEITRGSYDIYKININFKYVITIESFMLGFSGLCILFQVASSLDTLNIRITKLIKFSIIHGIISAVITYIILSFTPVIYKSNIPVLSSIDRGYIELIQKYNVTTSYIISISFIILFISLYMIYNILKDKDKNKTR